MCFLAIDAIFFVPRALTSKAFLGLSSAWSIFVKPARWMIKSRLILYTISKIYGKSVNIEKIHINDIIKLCNNNIGNKYLSPRKGIKIMIKKGKIFFL